MLLNLNPYGEFAEAPESSANGVPEWVAIAAIIVAVIIVVRVYLALKKDKENDAD
jgi:hypothetical protein